ncbi:hypothetical protein NIES2100_08650 [Calothrix sp. NIES-2100]|uniref:hypothetical protein n=1 Tax=Calothrix sp. NIES-2100 TaxID=1954172 RepID=UPI000B614F85|nr:hypothetical protein NIES2100_08650 [Calothrix sp. NIES-2100]
MNLGACDPYGIGHTLESLPFSIAAICPLPFFGHVPEMYDEIPLNVAVIGFFDNSTLSRINIKLIEDFRVINTCDKYL